MRPASVAAAAMCWPKPCPVAAPACGELLAAQIVGATRPAYERAFLPTRYDDPAYVAQLANWGSTGQL